MSALALRPYCEADLAAIADFWVESWRTTGFPLDFEARRRWLEKHLTTLVANGVRIIVARDAEGRPVGFVSIDPESGYLDQLCVASTSFGKGVGHALVREAMRLSPGMVELDVNEDNPRALRFYEREGFVAVTHGLSAGSGLPTVRMRWTAAQ